jgi:hypothetical protein
MGEREHFCGVGEGHGSFSGRVENIEEIDEEGDQAEMCVAAFRDPETETSSKKSPAHVREGEEQQRTSPKGVNGPHSGPGEEEVDQTKAP